MIPAHTPKAQEIITGSADQRSALEAETTQYQKQYQARETEKKFINRFVYIGMALIGLMLMTMFIYAGRQ